MRFKMMMRYNSIPCDSLSQGILLNNYIAIKTAYIVIPKAP